MKRSKYSHLFKKQLKKIRGKELQNILKKRDEILNSNNLNHYKNLTQNLKKYKRVHVNNSYVILFFGDNNIIYFVDYAHHDTIYKYSKKDLKKYNDLKF
ncbi:addiction module toxin RelE [archaeon]|jgi:mRNA-degrading endonuclease RelE of RelBE toxin-antitoxin system|nr:addiction module toxin RelE [archaeon]MBT4351355.1 addiction module toxin RelE [archaeon]MBT4648503.1 addiction module toxin RelE [archaeon]MBT6820836.1 addiction module toxin RelE [archaeon]MBT7391303.1 addiction module toxin RelE [archaeon]